MQSWLRWWSLAPVLITLLFLLLIIVFSSLSCVRGGSSIPRPTGPHVPPHLLLVTPPDGTSLLDQGLVTAQLDLLAGNGIPSQPAPSLFINGTRIDAEWVLFDGDTKGEVRYPGVYEFERGEYILEVRYKDKLGQEFTFSWRVEASGTGPPLK